MSARILKNDAEPIIAALERVAFGVNVMVAEHVRDEAASHSPVRTGSNKASFYVSTTDGSDYPEAVGEARSVNNRVQINPEIKPRGIESAVVGAAAFHDAIIELGGHGRAARPLMEPAAEKFRAFHRDALKKALPKGTR